MKKKDKRKISSFGVLHPRPNFDSSHHTALSLMFDLHWHMMDIERPWTWERFCRLCKFLSYTPYELASLVRLPHKRVERFRKNNMLVYNFHLHNGAPVSTLLTIVEHTAMKGWTSDVVPNPWPNVDSIHDVMTGRKG